MPTESYEITANAKINLFLRVKGTLPNGYHSLYTVMQEIACADQITVNIDDSRKGFKITEITVNHRSREHGHSKYGMERYMRGLLDSLTTTFLLKYSDRPMYFFGRIGLLTGFIGFVICAFLTVLWFMGQKIGGRPLLVLGVLLIVVGIQFISTGFVCNLVVDRNFRSAYDESHIKTII